MRELQSIPAAMKALDRIDDDVRNAKTFEALRTLANAAAALRQAFSGVKDVADRAGEVWVSAEIRLAEELDKLDKAKGGKPYQKGTGAKIAPVGIAPTRAELGLGGDAGKKRSARASKLLELGKREVKKIIAALKEEGKGITPNAILAKQRQETKQTHKHELATAVFSAEGPFDVVVIDPPWDMQKIDRDVRPNQDVFDYPTMSESQLKEFWLAEIAPKVKPDCHLFMWTTQRFLPVALGLTRDIGFKYVLTFVWHKSGGFQPIDLPQYNCEFIVYSRQGRPMFVDTRDFYTCFEAPRREHSRKPNKFYDTIRRATGGSRIDVFAREPREGFALYGNEIDRFGYEE